jgi:glycosyltransferase involved in cell wall biosynthesis
VDDASTDGTADVARANGARVIGVDFRHIARTRNAGARATSGAALIFVDADTVVSASVVAAAVDALRAGAAGGGALVHFDGPLPLWARLFIPVLRASMTAAKLAAGCFVFCSRDAFERAGGFDERLYAAEEIAFSRALRRRGRVVILRERVSTSGRKLRSHAGRDTLVFIGHVLRGGPRVLRSRERLSIWYGERRGDEGD